MQARAWIGVAGVCALASITGAAQSGDDEALKTRAERTKFEETSRLADVESFLRALGAKSDLLRVSTFGKTEEGRPLVLAMLSNPPVANPRELRALARPAVLVQANIHAGEVEGKEAAQNLMRRLALGDLRPVLDHLVVLIAPDYNADGNEAVDVMNRTEQYGPIAGVGRRENANGLDLNRDYMKLDSAEARAFVQLLNEWDPHVVVDLHTTNGSYHGYHLTYSIPVNLSFDVVLTSYERETLMPALQQAMLEKHSFRSYYYGNFETKGGEAKAGESKAGEAKAGEDADTRTWNAFDHRPRLGQNYVGLRNRIAILSEAYSYLDFKTRIAVTEAFVEEILRYTDEHAREVLALTASLDNNFVRNALADNAMTLGVEYQIRALPERQPLLVGEVTHELNPRNQHQMTVAVLDKFTTVSMQDFGYFAPKRTVSMARVYTLPRDERVKPAVDKLRQHGICVEELTAPLTAEVITFAIASATHSQRAFQKHNETRLTGSYATASTTLAPGTIVVRLAQPLGRLAAYLLEPESDDGLVNWNFFDTMLEHAPAAPIGKITRNVPMSTRVLEGF